jgi:hypothetical protein
MLKFLLSSYCGAIHNYFCIYLRLNEDFAVKTGYSAMSLVHTQRVDLDFILWDFIRTNIGLALLDIVE